MKILFFSDPHFGVKRAANTTPASMSRLTDKIGSSVSDLRILRGSEGVEYAVCCGDVFDSFTNSEDVILLANSHLDGLAETLLGGNHDAKADSASSGSLVLLKEFFNGEVILPSLDSPVVKTKTLPGVRLVLIPHHATQELFLQALDIAKGLAYDEHQILVLHCNYERGISSETSLNLTSEMAAALLRTYSYILLGHEHTPADYFGGRVRIIGNTYPLSIGEVADRRVLIYDSETGYMASVATAMNLLYKGEYSDDIPIKPFMDITFDSPTEAGKTITKLQKDPKVLMLRASYIKEDLRYTEKDRTPACTDLIQAIRDAFRFSPVLRQLFEDTLKEVREGTTK